jgi:hypothetical protein
MTTGIGLFVEFLKRKKLMGKSRYENVTILYNKSFSIYWDFSQI